MTSLPWLRSIAVAIALVMSAITSGAAPAPLPPQPAGVEYPTTAWPIGPLSNGTDTAALEAASQRLFSATGRGDLPDTRALLVIQGGHLVYERYADGFDRESPFRSFSAAKSVTQALLARLVAQGKVTVDQPAPVPEWQGPADPRAAITVRNLLHMDTGLDNADGGLDPDSFVARMIFGEEARDTAGFAARARAIHPPGAHWAYSTGTTQILSRIVARTVGGARPGMLAFIEKELAAPLGIESLTFEFDASGTPLGGIYAWLTARDWARFGLLYLRDGVWEDRRLLPEGWVDFTRTAGPAPNNKVYGAHFWLAGEAGADQFAVLPPRIDAFAVTGNGGQYILMIPDRDLVVVRLGEMLSMSWEDLGGGCSALIEAFPKVQP